MGISKGLARYQEAKRQAKALGGDYAKYVNQYYGVSKKLRKHGVKIKDTEARVLTPAEFNINRASEQIGIGKLVAEQFGLISGNAAKHLQQTLKQEGFDISLQRASTRQLSKSEWRAIDNYYQTQIISGVKPNAAKLQVSAYFFGS